MPKKKRSQQAPKKQHPKVAPVATTNAAKTRRPVIRQAANHVSVTHREYVAEITALDSLFHNRTYSINPGLAAVFPWLSSIASRFESYLFDRLTFIYEPVCPTTTPGSVMLAIDYDAQDNPASSKVVLMSYEGASRIAPWAATAFSARGGDLKKFGVQRYVRSGDITGTDIKTYDVGRFQLATQNTPAVSTVLGELYVQYTVRLFTPQINAGTTLATRDAQSQHGVFTIPSGTALPNLSAVILGSGSSPTFWLDPSTANHPLIRLFVNLNAAGPMIWSIWSQTNPYAHILQEYKQTSFSGGNENRQSNPWRLSGVYGMPGKFQAKGYTQGMYLAPEGSWNLKEGGASVVPFLIERPSSGSFNFEMTTVPVAVKPRTYVADFPTNTTVDWAYPQIDIPQLLPQISRGGSATIYGPNRFTYSD